MSQKWHATLTLTNQISNPESNAFFQSNLEEIPLMFAETLKGPVSIFQCCITAF